VLKKQTNQITPSLPEKKTKNISLETNYLLSIKYLDIFLERDLSSLHTHTKQNEKKNNLFKKNFK